MKLLQDKYSMNDTVHLTAVPGISVAKGGERELASAEVQESDTVRYVGPFDLRGGQAVFRFDGGHIYIPFAQTYQPRFFYYHVKDHLGNVRVTKIGVGETGSVLQRMNYYPFGGMMASSTGGAVQPYRYTGKELVRFQGLDWLDYGARWYDPTILRWNGVDKLAEKHCENTPYIFCGNNPIIYTDPNGLDYWSTSDPAQIQQFLSDFQNNRQHDMSGWQHTTDANFLANLFYNDQTNNYVYSYGKLEGGEVVCYAHIFTPIDRNWVEDINLIADAFANSLEKNSGKSVIGSNGNIYWQQKGKRPFYGNKYVKTYPLAKIGNRLSRVTGAFGLATLFYDLSTAYQLDGGVGYNTLKVGASWLGGTVGGSLLMQYGGQAGGLVGGPAGAVIGGCVGGVAGAYGGSYLGETIINYVYGVEE